MVAAVSLTLALAGVAIVSRAFSPADGRPRGAAPSSCPTGGSYVPILDPQFGPADSEVSLAGALPQDEGGESGQPGDPITKVVAWWNLKWERWSSALSKTEQPAAAGTGPVQLLGEASVEGMCDYEISFSVPEVDPGAYELVVIYQGRDVEGFPSYAAFEPVRFQVTGATSDDTDSG